MKASGFYRLPEHYYLFILLGLGSLFFFPFLGHLNLFDWDEINFAESSREMLVTGEYFRVQINYLPFWEKPPLFFWLQSLAMTVFGVNEFAARLPNAVFGLLTLYSIFRIGKFIKDDAFGLTWGLLYLMSFLPHIYFKSGIIDPVFNYFIFLSIFYIVRTINEEKSSTAALAGVFAGAAFLTKGPVAFVIIGLTYLCYLAWNRFKNGGKLKHILLTITVTVLCSFIWILPEVLENGFKTIGDFITYQIRLFSTPDAGHSQPFFYHMVVVFIGCFPMSLFALPLFKPANFPSKYDYTKWMVILFWVVMILFSIVKTKIVHYSSMCWLPMSFCAAMLIYGKLESSAPANKVSQKIFLWGGLLFSFILMIVPIVGYFRLKLIPFIKDPFAVANLQQNVDWQWWYPAIGILFGAGVIAGYTYIKKANYRTFLTLQTLNTGIILFIYLLLVAPKIEQHSQRTAINFYKSIAGQDVYVDTFGFKSYAHLYYFGVQPSTNPLRHDQEYLLRGDIDKPVYFVTKNTMLLLDDPKLKGFKLLKNEGGFKFYLRTPEKE